MSIKVCWRTKPHVVDDARDKTWNEGENEKNSGAHASEPTDASSSPPPPTYSLVNSHSSIAKIQGIRAFSPDNDEKITFYKPLTLIVGHNGAGKTTIIECLKMASTGDLPPNVRSGQNFIHDPKVAGEVEVKAQIKMRFNAQYRGSFSIIRNFSLKQMRKNLQFKALDQTLSIWNPDTNDFECLPQRCSNINQEVPFAMGVNKAILENVVFVHQEDSNWPLSEPANVKKRFDDIFAATKYTKALEEIKKLKNKQTTEAKEKRLQLETLKSYRDQAHRLSATVAESEQSIKAHSDNINELQREIEQIDERMKALKDELEDILRKKEQVSTVKVKFDILFMKMEEMKREMIEKYTEEDLGTPVEELESYRAEFTPRLAQMEESMKVIKQYISEAEAELKTVTLSKEGIMKMYGKIIGQAETYKKAVETMQTIGREVCAKFEIDVPPSVEDGTMKRDELEALMNKLQEQEGELTSDIEQAKAKQKEEDNALQTTIDTLNAKISATKEVVRLRQNKVKENEVEVEKLGKELDVLKGAGGSVAVDSPQAKLETELAEANRVAKDLEQEMLSNSHAFAIQEADKNLRKCDTRIKSLRVERSKLIADGEVFMRSKIMIQELDKLKEKERSFRSRNGSKVAITLGIAPSAITMSSEAIMEQTKKWIVEKENEERQAKQTHMSLREKFINTEVLLKSRQKSLEEAQKELSALSESLAGVGATATTVEEQIKSLQDLKEINMKKINFCDAYVEIWNEERDHASHQGSCASCERDFEGDDAKAAFVAKKQAMIDSMPEQAANAQRDVQEINTKLKALKLIEPDARRHGTLASTLIPKLTEDVHEASNQLMKIKIDFEAAELEFRSAQESLNSSKALLHEVITPWSQMLKQIEEQTMALGDRTDIETSAAAAKTIDGIDSELNQAEADRMTAQSARDEAASRFSALQDKISKSRDAMYILQEKIRQIGDGQQSKIALETKIASLVQDSESAATDAAEKSAELKKLDQEKKSLSAQKQKLQKSFDEGSDVRQSAINSLKLSISQLTPVVRQIGDSSRSPLETVKEMEASLNGIEQKKASLESRVAALKSELDGKAQDYAETQAFASQVLDLLSYKKQESEYESVKAEMEVAGLDTSVLEREPVIDKELKKLASKRSTKQSEADISAGSFAAIEENMKKAQDRLRSIEFDDIDTRYLSQMTEAQSIEIACSDLEKYHKALERTLLSFHASKMADINKTIKELWQKTYRGVDIDYIQIKADTETTSTRSSYNYRVVMFVGGAELDMRGRCSAGQKILSCLIIRLALAENFCLNCGVLALDEPTTNLDAENSASLAEALKSLMISRKDYESFQLIVITHDEEFAMRLGTRDNVEYLWRVSKDENQHSRIRREPIS